MDVSLIFHQVRLVLVGLRTKESEEVVKAFSGWPTIEWAGIGRLFVRSHAIFANRKCVVAVVAKNFCNGSGRGRNPAVPAGEAGGQNQCVKTRKRARMRCYGQSAAQSELGRRSRWYGSSYSASHCWPELSNVGVWMSPPNVAGSAKAHIIQQNPHYVRSAGRRFHRFRPPFF